jgi:TetR/AcrR family transcriptional regulator
MIEANGLSDGIQGGSGTRERLLAAAISLFSEQGYAATGTRAIAARAGCNVALISHYFGSKEGLLREVIVRGIATVGDELRALRAAPMSPEERLGRFVDFMVDHFDRSCQGMQIVSHQLAQAQSPFFAAILPKITENVELLTSMLEDAKGVGRLREVEPRTAAVLLMGMLQTYFTTYAVTSTLIGPRTPATIAELKRHITEIFVRGVLDEAAVGREAIESAASAP